MRPSLWVRCPACQRMTGMLDISLSRGSEHYYECEECGHVWTELPPAPIKAASLVPVVRRPKRQ